jgi:hypothetical protein
VNNVASARRCKGRFVEIQCTVELCLGQQSWINSGLRNKAAPEVHGKLFAGAAETGNEMIFPAADGAFGRIALMDVRRH